MHNLIQARTTLVASTLNGARRLDASGVLLPHQWHLKPRESSLAALHHVLNFQGRRLALLPPPPRRRSPRGELCPDLPSRPALPTTCPTEKKNPSKPHNCLPLHAGTFPSRLLGVGLVWWVAPLPARSRACRLSLSLAISRLAPAACVATASVAISRSNLIKSLWIYLLAV